MRVSQPKRRHGRHVLPESLLHANGGEVRMLEAVPEDFAASPGESVKLTAP